MPASLAKGIWKPNKNVLIALYQIFNDPILNWKKTKTETIIARHALFVYVVNYVCFGCEVDVNIKIVRINRE